MTRAKFGGRMNWGAGQVQSITSDPSKGEGENGSPAPARAPIERVHGIKRAILDAATKSFFTCGYEGASMDAIAAEAQVSTVTVYSRYTKESLLREVLEDRLSAWVNEFKRQPQLGNTLEARLRQRVESIMAIASSEALRDIDRLMAAAPAQLFKGQRQRAYNQIIKILADEIGTFTSAEGRPARDPRQVAKDLIAIVAGWFRIEPLARAITTQDLVAFGDRAVELFVAGRSVW